MKVIVLQETVRIPATRVIEDVVGIIYQHGYLGDSSTIDQGLNHFRWYEIYGRGVVNLTATDSPYGVGPRSAVSLMGFDETTEEFSNLEKSLMELSTRYQ